MRCPSLDPPRWPATHTLRPPSCPPRCITWVLSECTIRALLTLPCPAPAPAPAQVRRQVEGELLFQEVWLGRRLRLEGLSAPATA